MIKVIQLTNVTRKSTCYYIFFFSIKITYKTVIDLSVPKMMYNSVIKRFKKLSEMQKNNLNY